MERRNLLKAIGGIAATASAGGAGVIAMSGGASAQTTSTLNIADANSISNDDGDLSEVIVSLDHEISWDGFDVGVDAVAFENRISIVDGGGNDRSNGEYVLQKGDPVSVQLIADGGWGGSGETGTIDAVDEDSSSAGANALAGEVNSDIQWTILADEGAPISQDSIQDPAIIGQDIGDLDVNTDDSSTTYTITFKKIVRFYRENNNGGYVLLDNDDGTVGKSVATGNFDVTVTNEAASTTSETNSEGSTKAK
ncbi:hypothetical protein [Halorubrum sp. CBA1229]|uniref:hypothetical protein n=1 Tax=Halorubrum sp. CBA1229 TaxID=1853699 RepID=UPI0011CE73E0|nr:hypothetical protein [Halorubrum sp. CBA1229]QKY16086.1 hypothetical protein Hrr1229_004005 [Halorubrum sp. CBA1229]